MPTYEDVLSLAKRLPRDDLARLLVALSAMVATSPTNGLDAVEVAGTDELIAAEEIAESEAALQSYRAGRDPGINAAALKHKTISLQQCPDDPIEAFIGEFSSNTPDWVDRHDVYLGQAFASAIDFVEKHHTTDTPEAQPLSLQDIAALPLAQRYTLLSPYMAATAEDLAQDPALTEFADLD